MKNYCFHTTHKASIHFFLKLLLIFLSCYTCWRLKTQLDVPHLYMRGLRLSITMKPIKGEIPLLVFGFLNLSFIWQLIHFVYHLLSSPFYTLPNHIFTKQFNIFPVPFHVSFHQRSFPLLLEFSLIFFYLKSSNAFNLIQNR